MKLRKHARGCAVLLMAFSLMLPLFCGCQSAPRESGDLWIVTEQSTWDRMNGQLYALEEAYEKEHPGVQIRVEYLPTDQQERDVYLQQLRTEILQGGGPDCYLLPTSNTLILDEPAQYTYVDVEPLFADVELAMGNGLFYDITELYDADSKLDKACLNTAVMDSGVVNGSRYVLPLRYDMPVIYGRHDALEAAGLDPSILYEDINTIMESVFASGDPVLSSGILYGRLDVFSDFLDYETGNTLLSEDALSRYLTNYLNLKSLVDGKEVPQQKLNLVSFIRCHYRQDKEEYFPLWIGSMQDLLEYVPLSFFDQYDVTVTPLQTAEGDVIATVTYYAAVGSGCDDPALAYDFLRQFLLEESQLESNRPERNHTKPLKGFGQNTSNDLQYPGLIEEGWPVRDQDTLNPMWNIRRLQLYVRAIMLSGSPEHSRRMRKIGYTGEIAAEKVPLFGLSFGDVRFNTTLSDAFSDILEQVDPAQADIDKLTQQVLWNLRWHVSEG